tara:strand:+ start:133 stop:1014 length:882 start_codon:yes stop_codon:yes gene_type:complete
MNNIRVTILGADGYTCQIPRIKEGMESLGHILTKETPDIIYSNDPRGYDEALFLKKKYPNSYVIFNFLDIPWQAKNIEEQTKLLVKHYFSKANIITAISFKVKKDLEKFYNKDIEVIYNPVKDIYFDKKIKKNNDFLYVGRANDPIKRIKLAYETLAKNPEHLKNIKICGSENPGFGKYVGIVSDEDLNKLYNSSKFILLPSKAEGIGLPMIEGMICGCIPITCSDNLTAKEFSPSDFICEPNAESMLEKIKNINNQYESKRLLALQYGEKYKIQFNKKNIAKNIIDVFNSHK